jgi:hypothetical protein
MTVASGARRDHFMLSPATSGSRSECSRDYCTSRDPFILTFIKVQSVRTGFRTRRELHASLALARTGSPAHRPILAHLGAIDAELVARGPGLPGA